MVPNTSLHHKKNTEQCDKMYIDTNTVLDQECDITEFQHNLRRGIFICWSEKLGFQKKKKKDFA